MSPGPLFGPLFAGDALREAISDEAYLGAMLEFEAALAAAEARAGVIPFAAAEAISEACEPGRFDMAAIGRAGVGSAAPVAPLVAALRSELPAEAAGYAHWGATTQDVLDTATMLVARRTLALVIGELDGVAAALAALAEQHRGTLMAGRTLLQQALPVTFGLKAAGWLVAVLDARRRLIELRASGLAVQLGGAAGTLAALGDEGEDVLRALAAKLELPEPVLPWHTARGRMGELAGALAVAAGAVGKAALDLVLLAQTEVGEVAEGRGGGSSTMPHKRNPAACVRARAGALRAQAAAGAVLAAMAQEHERAAGHWQAESEPLREALALTGGAAAALREALDGLQVDTARMRANLEATGGLLMAERVTFALAERAGRTAAAEAVERAAAGGGSFRDALLAEPVVAEHLSAPELDELLDPAGYLGCAEAFVDRALALHRREEAA